jgi:hypothetical protein
MSTQPEALRLAEQLKERFGGTVPTSQAAAELRRLHHNNQVLTDALWKACGDDEDMVSGTIASQGELTSAQEEHNKVRAERDALRADAERYAYVIANARRIDICRVSLVDTNMDQLSARIDAAREAK